MTIEPLLFGLIIVVAFIAGLLAGIILAFNSLQEAKKAGPPAYWGAGE